MAHQATLVSRSLRIPVADVTLDGDLNLPDHAHAIVVFAHGSGSSRHSPRNQFVASELNKAGLATLLFDLLTPEEEEVDEYSAQLRFDIPMLADRLIGVTDWLATQPETRDLPMAYFGASTGAAAALVAAAQRPQAVKTVVSRGGRPDLANDALPHVQAPTLLIVGGEDFAVFEMNQEALNQLRCEKRLQIVPGATHLFEEPGTLEEVARIARDWFQNHLSPVHSVSAR